MPKISRSRLMAGAVLSAALTPGSLSLAATTASACTGTPNCGGGPPPVAARAFCPDKECSGGPPPSSLQTCTDPRCVNGVPPVARVSSLECTEPRCGGGTTPAAAPWPGARPAINCPPSVAARTIGGDGPGC